MHLQSTYEVVFFTLNEMGAAAAQLDRHQRTH